jgi:hypothetical protein
MISKNITSKQSFLGFMTGVSLAIAMVVSLPGNAQSQENRSNRAEELLSQMTSYLKNTQSFSFNAEITQDKFLREDQKIKRGAIAEYSVQRPNKLHAEYNGDLRDVSFYYDGNEFTMIEANKNVYAVIPVTSDIDGLVNTIENDYGFVIPMGSFISTDLHSAIAEQIIASDYLGVAKIQGNFCHHLAFSLEHIDLQIWVSEAENPLPCKFVITYKEETGFPEYTAIFSDWNFAIPPNDPRFTVTLPENVHEIQVLPNRLGKQ